MKNNMIYYLQKTSHWLYTKKVPIIPFLIKQFMRITFSTVLPYELKTGNNVHYGYHGLGIVIHRRCKIGNNVLIAQNVSIGGKGGPGVPTIGNNVLLGAGSKVLGGVKIGNNCKIGANSVVTIDVPDNHVAAGLPAKIIKKV